MGFDVTPKVTADWTNNLDVLQTGINRLRPGGGTAMFDAVYTACRDKLLSERGQEPERKAMSLISDGTTTKAACTPMKPSRCVSAPRPSSTRSALTGRRAAARATRS